MVNQRTIKTSVKVTGVGLHSGQKVTLGMRPAPVDTGIVFCRVDQKPIEQMAALGHLVNDTRMSTCMLQNGVRVATIEHLMSALAGLGIDNLYVDLDSPEVPIMDG
ncbi:MAG: UDP-3-O-acyl-N-acetylglucosamine deacetylase, partial [Gallionella sp.]